MLALRARAAPAVALVAGVLQALAIAAPWNGQPQWWLQLASLALLAALLHGEDSARRAALHAWLFATAWLCATFWWLFISMHVYGGLPSPMAAAAVVLLAGFLALYYALAGALFAKLASGRAVVDSGLFAALWMGAELLRGTLFTGFPWGAGGYAHVDGPLAFLARWAGVYGIGFAAAALACVIARVLRLRSLRSKRGMTAAALIVGLLAACNFIAVPAQGPGGPRISVALLQGNIPQDEKFEPGSGVPIALAWYAEQLQAAKAQLVVAPETSIPLLPRDLPEGYLAAIARRFEGGAQAALVGIPLGSLSQGYTNSVLGFQAATGVYRYDKHHLVPFGEFIPPFFRWFTRMMNIPLGDFNRGAVGQASFAWNGERLAPNICYEDLFGEELGARFIDEATAPTMFVNVSNIGWFGNSIAIDQHLAASRMRALEFERPMLRATNTGATAVIDRHGRVTHQLPRHQRGVLLAQAEGGRGITPFAWWVSRFGLWPLAVLAVAIPGALWLRLRRATSAPAAPDAPA